MVYGCQPGALRLCEFRKRSPGETIFHAPRIEPFEEKDSEDPLVIKPGSIKGSIKSHFTRYTLFSVDYGPSASPDQE